MIKGELRRFIPPLFLFPHHSFQSSNPSSHSFLFAYYLHVHWLWLPHWPLPSSLNCRNSCFRCSWMYLHHPLGHYYQLSLSLSHACTHLILSSLSQQTWHSSSCLHPFTHTRVSVLRCHWDCLLDPMGILPRLTLAPEPFLGFSSLGTGMTGQVNQQRLTSSAATQPRQPQLPSCGSCHHRGPAVQPQPLHWVPRIKDCISNINSEVVMWLAVKVYPPQVSSPPSDVSSINFIFSKCQMRTCSTTNTLHKPS